MKRVLTINARGLRVGESHQNARLTDREVDRIREMLDERDAFVARVLAAGYTRGQARMAVSWMELDVRSIARMFDVGSSTVQDIYTCRRRAQTVVGHRVVRVPDE